MLTDDNKNVNDIEYNFLNLPTKVQISSGLIRYVYDALGTKLKKTVSDDANDDIVSTEYVGGFIYETDTDNSNSSLKFFGHPEGYIEPSGSNWEYIYQYKDHLGNIRLSYKDIFRNNGISTSLQIQEENNYYPFGLKHKGYNTNIIGNDHKYGFGGKEEQDDNISGSQLNWLDFHARNYDAAIGRWMNLDPLADSELQFDQSAYAYTWNNPVNLTDPTGMHPDDNTNWKKKLLGENNEGNYSSVTISGLKGGGSITLGSNPTSYDQGGKKKLRPSKETREIKKAFYAAARRFDDPPNNGDGLFSETPLLGPLLRSGDRLNEGNYLGAIEEFGWGLIDLFSGGSGGYLGNKASQQTAKVFGRSFSKKTAASGMFYSVAYEMKLSTNLYPGGAYYQHFKAANKSLFSDMDSRTMSRLNINFQTGNKGNILWGRSPHNWVWHHDIETGVMQLVPKSQHTTGSIFWKTLHPDGVGGMNLWNKIK